MRIVASVVGVVLATPLGLAQSISLARADFPVEQGLYWDYSGLVAREVPGLVSIQTRTVSWRMEITEVIKREWWITAAVLKGHPRDLTTFEPDTPPGDYLLVKAHLQKHYLLQGDRALAAARRLRDSTDSLVDLVRDSEIILESPLFVGQRFCDAAMLTRLDVQNCWYIDTERNPSLESVPGLPPAWDGPEYELTYRSAAATEVIGFAPGIGITSYDYARASDRSYVQLKLTALGRR
jgi:hypothetical protein